MRHKSWSEPFPAQRETHDSPSEPTTDSPPRSETERSAALGAAALFTAALVVVVLAYLL